METTVETTNFYNLTTVVTPEPTPAPEPLNLSEAEYSIFAVILGIIAFVVIIQSLILIISILRNEILREFPLNQFLVSLAAADLFNGVLGLPLHIISRYTLIFNPKVCIVAQYIFLLAKTGKIVTLAFICWERHRSAKATEKRYMKSTEVRVFVALVWAIAILYACTAVDSYNQYVVDMKTLGQYVGDSTITFWACTLEYDKDGASHVNVLMDLIIFYVILLIVAFSFYGCQLHSLCTKTAIYTKRKNKQIAHEIGNKETRIALQVMMLLLLISYAVFRLPLNILQMYIHWGPGWWIGSYRIRAVVETLAYMTNFATFPIIMAFNKQLRAASAATVKCRTLSRVEQEALTTGQQQTSGQMNQGRTQDEKAFETQPHSRPQSHFHDNADEYTRMPPPV